jgi:hypothetical protein
MPATWDPVLYRDGARRWRKEAESLPPGKDRDACIALADGYTKLAALIEGRDDQLGRHPAYRHEALTRFCGQGHRSGSVRAK